MTIQRSDVEEHKTSFEYQSLGQSSNNNLKPFELVYRV